MLKKFVCCLFFSSCCVAYGGQDIPQAPTLSLATPMTNVGAPVIISQTTQQLQQGTSSFPGYVLSQKQVCSGPGCDMSVASVGDNSGGRRPLLALLRWLRDRRDTENTLDRTVTRNSTRRTLRGN